MGSRGCYSIRYVVEDSVDRGLEFSMDYRRTQEGGQWACFDSEIGVIKWIPRRIIPNHGVQAVIDHFGLTKEDLAGCDFLFLLRQSPAALVRTRRAKECRENLPRKEICNMRLGCNSGELLPDVFEAA